MKYLPLLVLGLIAGPAFADDANVKAVPIPNETTTTAPMDALCLATGNLMVKQTCALNDPKLVLVDNVNVTPQLLPNETAIPGRVSVNLICLVQSDASVNACKVADGDKSSSHNVEAAIEAANGKIHVTGAFVAGNAAHLKVTLNAAHALPLVPIR